MLLFHNFYISFHLYTTGFYVWLQADITTGEPQQRHLGLPQNLSSHPTISRFSYVFPQKIVNPTDIPPVSSWNYGMVLRDFYIVKS